MQIPTILSRVTSFRVISLRPLATRRNLILVGLLTIALAVLVLELRWILPIALERWHPFDYDNYMDMGRRLLAGENPYGQHRYYPLPVALYIFAPLSLLPEWFELIWIIVPLAFILILFRDDAIWALLFAPVWFAAGQGMIDSWLLIPLVWLFKNRPVYAGIAAALLSFKPHIFVFTLAFMFLSWVLQRDWRNLKAFALAMVVLYLPAFLVDPAWPLQMLAALPLRTQQSLNEIPLLTATIWPWWDWGGWARIVFVALVAATVILVWRGWRQPANRAGILQVLGLLTIPLILPASQVTMLPLLQGRKQILIVVLLSWAAFAFSRMVVGGFDGGYAFAAVAVLYFLGSSPPMPERANT